MLRILRFVHLARVPLLTLAILGLIGPIGYHVVPGVFLGILDIDSNWNAFLWVCIAAFFVQASAVTTLNVIILYGSMRFDDLKLRQRNATERAELQSWILLLSNASSVFLLIYLLWINTSPALPLY